MRSNHCHIQIHNMPVRISFSQVGGGGGGGSIPDERKASSTTQIIARTALVNTTTYSGEITNHYTWQGRKLGKSLRNSQGTLTLDETYYDELMLNFGKPSRISHADGYVSLDENGNTTFYYYLKDHLGNVRSLITPDTDGKPHVVQANDYFPFGMSFESPITNLSYKSTTTNKHKYNGKEEQEMPGKWLDYGARFYDAQIGRWHGVDPLAEDYHPISPYAYVANNSINAIDPDGKEIWIITGRDSRGNAQQVQYREGNLYNEDGSDYEGENDFAIGLQSIFNALYALGDDFTNEVLSTVEDSKVSHYFEQESEWGNRVIPIPSTQLTSKNANDGKPINTHVALNFSGKSDESKTASVSHELRHVYDYDQGKMKGEVAIKPSHEDPKEIRAVNFENRTRVRIGLMMRTTYGSKKIDSKKLLDPKKKHSE